MGTGIAPLALVVEDDPLLRLQLANLLRQHGIDVIECDGVEAAELVLARTGLELSLLVTDIELGRGKEGLELVTLAVSKFPRVVIVSGRSGLVLPKDVVFLSKPIAPAELLNIVASIT